MDPYLPPEDQDLDNPYAPPQSAFVRAAAPRQYSAGSRSPSTTSSTGHGPSTRNGWGPAWPYSGVSSGVNWALGFAMQMVLTGLMAVVEEPALFMVLNFLIAP